MVETAGEYIRAWKLAGRKVTLFPPILRCTVQPRYKETFNSTLAFSQITERSRIKVFIICPPLKRLQLGSESLKQSERRLGSFVLLVMFHCSRIFIPSFDRILKVESTPDSFQ
jgi:hypothetical protein